MTPRVPKTNSPLRRHERKALEQQEALTKKYMAEGMSKEKALERALAEMRDNARKYWRI